MPEHPLTIWTVGHSTLPIERFLALLGSYQIELIADVRRYPASRRNPQFNQSALAEALAAAGIAYRPMPELGGRRAPRPDSHNTAWREASFRGYADHMETPAFRQAISQLLEAARAKRTAILCAEAVWFRCHRALIADYLKSLGVQVIHIFSPAHSQEHPYTSAAHLIHGRLSYAEPTLWDSAREQADDC